MYVLDTGIRSTHEEFGFPGPDGSKAPPPPGGPSSRVGPGFDAVYDSSNVEDCHGHGSHVGCTWAGTSIKLSRAVAGIDKDDVAAVEAGLAGTASLPLMPCPYSGCGHCGGPDLRRGQECDTAPGQGELY